MDDYTSSLMSMPEEWKGATIDVLDGADTARMFFNRYHIEYTAADLLKASEMIISQKEKKSTG
jgi:hypothetical protein